MCVHRFIFTLFGTKISSHICGGSCSVLLLVIFFIFNTINICIDTLLNYDKHMEDPMGLVYKC